MHDNDSLSSNIEPPPLRRRQFTLRAMFAAVTMMAVLLACRDWLPGWARMIVWCFSPVAVLVVLQIVLFWVLQLAGVLPKFEMKEQIPPDDSSNSDSLEAPPSCQRSAARRG